MTNFYLILLYSFPRASLKNSYKRDGLREQKFILSLVDWLLGQRPTSRCYQGNTHFKDAGGKPALHLFQLEAAGALMGPEELQSLPPSPHGLSFCESLLRKLAIGLGAHPG